MEGELVKVSVERTLLQKVEPLVRRQRNAQKAGAYIYFRHINSQKRKECSYWGCNLFMCREERVEEGAAT